MSHANTHTHARARTHARTHAHTHTRTVHTHTATHAGISSQQHWPPAPRLLTTNLASVQHPLADHLRAMRPATVSKSALSSMPLAVGVM